MFRMGRRILWNMNMQMVLAICFFAGILAGTAACNWMGSELTEQFQYVSQFFLTGASYSKEYSRELFSLVFRQRALEVLGAWLIGLTVLSGPGFALIAGYYGLSLSVILSITTMQKGIMGLPLFLATLLPQWLVYLPVFVVLAVWALSAVKKPRIAALLILLAAVALGSVLEVTVNPLVIGYFG